MYNTFVAWVYGVTFAGLFGYVAWILARLRRVEEDTVEDVR